MAMRDWSDLRELYVEKNLSTPQIAHLKGVSPPAVLYHLHRQGIDVKQRNWRRMRHPVLMPSPELSYLIGALAGDGWISRNGSGRVTLKVKSKAFAEQTVEAYATIGLIGSLRETSTGHWEANTKSIEFTTWWHETHDFRKAETALHFRDQFIQGLFDAEGSVFQRKGDSTPRVAIDCGRGDIMGAVLGALYGYGYNVTTWVVTTDNGVAVRRMSIQDPEHVSRFLAQFPSRVKFL